MSNTTVTQSITIRPATDADEGALIRLAQRDSAPVPDGRLLVAVADGSIRAAVAVESGTTIADPFQPTADLVELLRTRATGPRRPTRMRVIAGAHPQRQRLAA
jgi:hypothetical protein